MAPVRARGMIVGAGLLLVLTTRLPLLAQGDTVPQCDEGFAARPQANPPMVNSAALLDSNDARAIVSQEYERIPPQPGPKRMWIWVLVDTSGQVAQAKLYRSSGEIAVDSAGLRALSRFRFSPGTDREGPVCSWYSLPLTYPASWDSGLAESQVSPLQPH